MSSRGFYRILVSFAFLLRARTHGTQAIRMTTAVTAPEAMIAMGSGGSVPKSTGAPTVTVVDILGIP